MFGFQLGREFKLSIAEILTVFPEGKIVCFDKEILIIDFKNKEKFKSFILENADNLGGTIKVIEILPHPNPLLRGEGVEGFLNKIIGEIILKIAEKHEGKFKYGISVFGEKINLKSILINTKKIFKDNGISSRFINNDFKNLYSAQIIGEKLIKNNTDYNIISTGDKIYFGNSIWVQDIYNYSKRDWQKDRDMSVGMLPPKLAQIMINLSRPHPNPLLIGEGTGGLVIYDPFVGLGTVLIESILMGNGEVFGSDLSERMVEISRKNIESLNKNIKKIEIFKQNAKYINEIEILKNNNIDAIVTEGYLGEIMTQKNISPERIEKQKKSLLDLYEGFFSGLNKLEFKGNIVISFPFWEIKSKYFYFNEIYDTIKKYCIIQKLFPTDIELYETKSGSLLYKRDNQLVGREIFKMKIK